MQLTLNQLTAQSVSCPLSVQYQFPQSRTGAQVSLDVVAAARHSALFQAINPQSDAPLPLFEGSEHADVFLIAKWLNALSYCRQQEERGGGRRRRATVCCGCLEPASGSVSAATRDCTVFVSI